MEFFINDKAEGVSESSLLSLYRSSQLLSTDSIRCVWGEDEVFEHTLFDLVARNGAANPFIHVPDNNKCAVLEKELADVRSQLTASEKCFDELCSFLSVDVGLIRLAATFQEHFPLIMRSEDRADDSDADVNNALQALRKKVADSFHHEEDMNKLLEKYLFSCDLCSLQLDTPAEMFHHVIGEEHLQKLPLNGSRCFTLRDVRFWQWVVGRILQKRGHGRITWD